MGYQKYIGVQVEILSLVHKTIDFFPRVVNKLKRIKLNIADNDEFLVLSDSQGTYYENAISSILDNKGRLSKFRRIYNYREILEHVDYHLGKKYLERIRLLEPSLLSQVYLFQENDNFGSPRIYKYQGIGRISPTTLRYIYTAAEMRKLFGVGNAGRIAEIGAGYGGQASILHKLGWFSSYSIFDLESAQRLIAIYLTKQGVTRFTFPTLEESDSTFDLVISNYAFSELPKNLQMFYLEKVILKSTHGYMQMNSGKFNLTKRSTGKLSVEELLRIIPNSRLLPENPLSGPDNYLLVWGAKSID